MLTYVNVWTRKNKLKDRFIFQLATAPKDEIWCESETGKESTFFISIPKNIE